MPLYLILIHHQTTTKFRAYRFPLQLYLILIHHQTTTSLNFVRIVVMLYLILIHHQTTTSYYELRAHACCISSLFITKPQRYASLGMLAKRCISSLFITKPQHYGDYTFRVRCCISSLFITKPQPIFSNFIVYNNIYTNRTLIKWQGDYLIITKILKKLQLNRNLLNFLFNCSPYIYYLRILLVCNGYDGQPSLGRHNGTHTLYMNIL